MPVSLSFKIVITYRNSAQKFKKCITTVKYVCLIKFRVFSWVERMVNIFSERHCYISDTLLIHVSGAHHRCIILEPPCTGGNRRSLNRSPGYVQSGQWLHASSRMVKSTSVGGLFYQDWLHVNVWGTNTGKGLLTFDSCLKGITVFHWLSSGRNRSWS